MNTIRKFKAVSVDREIKLVVSRCDICNNWAASGTSIRFIHGEF